VRGGLLAFGCLLLLWVEAVRADRGIALELHEGSRPEDADRILTPFFEELDAQSFADTREAARARVHEHLSADAGALTEQEKAEFTRAVRDGVSLFNDGKFEQAETILRLQHKRFAENQIVLADDQGGFRPLYYQTLGTLAAVSTRLGKKADAEEYLAELARAFPDQPFARRQWGPDLNEAFDKIRQKIGVGGRSTLTVTVDDPNALVVVNGRYIGVRKVALPDLLPGAYRVFIKSGTQQGRVHEITVRPNAEEVVDVELGFDATIRSASWVGLLLPSASEANAKGRTYARRVGRAVGADYVVVVGVYTRGGERLLHATVYNSETGRILRRGSLGLDPEPPPASQIRGLAEFISTGRAIPGIKVEEGGIATPPTRFRTLKWATLFGGVGAAAVGGVLIALDKPRVIEGEDGMPSRQSPTYFPGKIPGLIMMGVGVGVMVTGVVLFVIDKPIERPSVRPAVAVTSNGSFVLGLSGAF
jgi:hypothetical protein